jgi:ketosteroid isomerase-like protein
MKTGMLVVLTMTMCAALAPGVTSAPTGPDEASINALLDRFEAAIAKDDIKAVESCLYRKGYLQIYDYSEGGIGTATLSNWTNNPTWFASNESVKLNDRRITVDRNIAFARFVEVSRHRGAGTSSYRSMFILVKEQDRWLISVTSGRQL